MNGAGADAVDGDTIFHDFGGERGGKANQAVFARGIGAAVQESHACGDGGDVNDASVFALLHFGHKLFTEKIRNGEIDKEGLFPDAVIEFNDGFGLKIFADAAQSRVVHKNIEMVKGLMKFAEDDVGTIRL